MSTQIDSKPGRPAPNERGGGPKKPATQGPKPPPPVQKKS